MLIKVKKNTYLLKKTGQGKQKPPRNDELGSILYSGIDIFPNAFNYYYFPVYLQEKSSSGFPGLTGIITGNPGRIS